MKKSQVPKEKFDWKNKLRRFTAERKSFKTAIGPLDEGSVSLTALSIALSRKHPVLLVTSILSSAERFRTEAELWSEALGFSVSIGLLPEGAALGQRLSENDTPRTKVLFHALNQPPGLLCAPLSALLAPAPPPEKMRNSKLRLTPGMEIPLQELARKLVEMDYDDETEVTVPGEFARRGGIIDIFSPSQDTPVRIEFWGDTIESIRTFQPETQRSCNELDSCEIILRSDLSPGGENSGEPAVDFMEYVRIYKPIVVLAFPDECERYLERFAPEETAKRWKQLLADPAFEFIRLLDAPSAAMASELMRPGCYPSAAHILKSIPDGAEESFAELARQMSENLIRQWQSEGIHVILAGKSEADLHYIREWMKESAIAESEMLEVASSPLPCGVFLPEEKFAILTEQELFSTLKRLRSPRIVKKEAFDPNESGELDFISTADLEEGDYAVHINFGICIYRGMKEIDTGGARCEVLTLEFDDETIVNIPIWQAHYISRYIGSKKAGVPLSRLSGSRWTKAKENASSAIRTLAFDMLKMQALRTTASGAAFPPDDLAQRLFEQAFPFQETPDQLKSAEEIKKDMESEKPMDRLLCGDVGYGKTELAMRAVFKCVSAGKQAAILVPTTILAQQHYYSFLERFAETPVIIETLSRFKTKGEQTKIIERLKEGTVDIVIGTHRLVQGDIEFKNLGLIVIDEEQRFGVVHKERLKHLRSTVDVLTMTATPIPRTLYFSMAGLRDLSTIMSAPVHRLPVQTIVAQTDDAILVSAVNRELQRGGQVYYLHNRVATIQTEAERLGKLFPDARIGIGHGQMSEDELESAMNAFIEGRIDIFVCTTIIESGLDIPNANTIIIDRADRFGLAELYQLRGRVGRWTRQAYAYFLLPRSGILTGDARKRIAAIRRYTHLGAGFKLALRDLEIRGSGNILGSEQSGQINAVGFHLYCQLLRACISQIKGEAETPRTEPSLFMDFLEFALVPSRGKIAAGIPTDYITASRLRLDIYRRLASASTEEKLEKLIQELRDRFGKLPETVENLALCTRIRLVAGLAMIDSIACRDGRVYIERSGNILKPDGLIPRIDNSLPPVKRLQTLHEIISDHVSHSGYSSIKKHVFT